MKQLQAYGITRSFIFNTILYTIPYTQSFLNQQLKFFNKINVILQPRTQHETDLLATSIPTSKLQDFINNLSIGIDIIRKIYISAGLNIIPFSCFMCQHFNLVNSWQLSILHIHKNHTLSLACSWVSKKYWEIHLTHRC